MFTVHYEEYHCDYLRKEFAKQFASLEEIEEWMFGQMRQKYQGDSGVMYFPCGDEMSTIEFRPVYGGPHIWIHRINTREGIVFSDGRQTAGQKFGSQRVREWLKHCRRRRDNPVFNFVE